MKRGLLIGVTLFLATGCVTMAGLIDKEEVLNPAQQKALNEAMAQPLEFSVSKSASDAAWGRATEFLASHSSMKLQTTTDYLLQTYNSTTDEPDILGGTMGHVRYSYSVTRRPDDSAFKFKVNCSGPAVYIREEIEKAENRNAHILAYFIATGKLECPELILK